MSAPGARLIAPREWARGDGTEPQPEPVDRERELFVRLIGGPLGFSKEHQSTMELDVCASCFRALFGAAAWLQVVMQTKGQHA